MPPKAIIIRFSDNVDSSRELTAVATGIAFSFSDRFADRKSGARRLVVYVSAKHIWHVWWTQARAVAVQCERSAP